MSVEVNVLLVDDHPLILDSYKRAFDFCNTDLEIIFKETSNCDQAIQFINECQKLKKSIDFAIIDVRIPASESKAFVSGEDVAILLRTQHPNSKIVMSTSIDSSYRIHNIIKSVNPSGFLIKVDISPKELINSINSVLNGETYYSKTVITYFRKTVSSNIFLDPVDRKLLYELSIGTRMKDLPEILNLSIAAIEKRKRNLKIIFDVNANDDKELLDAARENGFI